MQNRVNAFHPSDIIDVFDRGPRFKAHRWAVRISSLHKARTFIVDDFPTQSQAAYIALMLTETMDEWLGEAAVTGYRQELAS